VLFQVLQFFFGRVLLFNIPEDLSYILLEPLIVSKYLLGSCFRDCGNPSFGGFVYYEIIDISLNPVENYPTKVTDSINYLSSFGSE
jgi:hypothetical protein